ncbi:hypothetical protein TorRG33x02_269310 [Trema orientale]|uniref:Lysine ketoglutarate reductase trans-splicing-like protein n=1 Tax=Trema orientale TaxID=63057 RepID=A0A2P5CY03_TREOI|nr:hypothetical protein TorRG33x02_269310 [Trema orientale]
MENKQLRPFYCIFVSAVVLFSAAFIWSAIFVIDNKESFSAWKLRTTRCDNCETQRWPHEIDALPRGIVRRTSDLLMQPLWGPRNKKNPKISSNLLAMAVGIKLKENVNKIVNKFLKSNFVVMLFHYDGNVNDWKDLEWSARAIHVSAINQTKWWFAKRFMHPDIIPDYSYIFLWDEDLGVENFHVDRYLSIVKEEGLQISQPALDLNKSEVHHDITVRVSEQRVHRWVEMMAPVFSTASWRCAWHLIQGDRTKKVGVVDSEYIIHYGLPTLGGSEPDNKAQAQSTQSDARTEVRKLSFTELEIFKHRWFKAIKEDGYWKKTYQKPPQKQAI